ncbi:MAG: hypothetical protein UU98_C0024G0004 [Parcubacteria group bacterium GW2011_GWD2_42_14]|nr:MAG: hypothetical protein UU98_C0024G0004 [Parcubacteria group bacterium GW2011_GWD2_42_14]
MGASMRVLLNQNENESLPIETQTILLSLVFTSFSSEKDAAFFSKNHAVLSRAITENKEFVALRKSVRTEKSFDQFLGSMEKQLPYFKKVCLG